MPIAPIIGDQNTARNDRVMELLCHKYDSGIRKNVPFACGYHQEHGEGVLCFAVGAAGTAEASTAGRYWSFRLLFEHQTQLPRLAIIKTSLHLIKKRH